MIQITKNSGRKQRYLKKIIIVLLVAIGIFMIAFGSIVCNQLRQPHNYIEAIDSDSIEMKTAELLSGMDGRSATAIGNKCMIEYGAEQGLAALIYGEKWVSSLPIQNITGKQLDTDNEYIYYYSIEFVK